MLTHPNGYYKQNDQCQSIKIGKQDFYFRSSVRVSALRKTEDYVIYYHTWFWGLVTGQSNKVYAFLYFEKNLNLLAFG